MKIVSSIAITIAISLCTHICFSQPGGTYLGTDAGNGTNGLDNVAIGYVAGNVVTGTGNVLLGAYAGTRVTSGGSNSVVGYDAGAYTTTGSYNVFMGRAAGNKQTSASYNVFLGYNAGFNNLSGNNNVAVGNHAGYSSTGAGNLFLGTNAGYYSTGSGNIFIGQNAGYNSTTASNVLFIDNSNVSTPLIYGHFTNNHVGINAIPPAGSLHTLTVGGSINSTGGIFINGVAVAGDLTYWVRDANNGTLTTNHTVYTGTLHANGLFVNGLPVGGDQSFWTKVGMTNNFYNATDNVGIGFALDPAKNSKNYKLAVKGKVGAWEVEIENSSLIWSDFVFKKDYKLLSLPEVEQFIQENGHLPSIPSEKEIREDGLRVAEMDAKLLMKIEELTLYVIELQKQVEELKKDKKK
jgi:trimeric autotransporter adhesin